MSKVLFANKQEQKRKITHLGDVRVVKQNPDFHLGVEEESGVVVSVIADQADEVEPCGHRPVCLYDRVEHLKCRNCDVSLLAHEL